MSLCRGLIASVLRRISMKLKQYIQFLKSHGAAEIEHSGEDFLSHLMGVMELLKAWKAPEHLCLAGLFHSVYGTEVFQESLIPNDLRPKVQKLIGEGAEEIAYLPDFDIAHR